MTNSGKFYKNSVVTAGGEAIAAFASFITLALLARSLEPNSFGQLTLAMAYALSFDLLLNFQSWRLVIRYGAKLLEQNDLSEFGRILKLAALLDAGSAIGATLIGILFVGLLIPIVGGGDERVFYLFSITILFNVVGHSTGILRLFERFVFLSAHKVMTATARLLAVVIVIALGEGDLLNVSVALVVAECAMKLVLFLRGVMEVRNQGLSRMMGAPLRGVRTDYPDIVSFSVYSSLNDTVLKVIQQLDVFIIAFFMTPSAAGSFRLVKSLGSICTMVASAIGQVIYPEMARIYANSSDRLAPFLKRVRVGLFIITIAGFGAYCLIGDYLIVEIFGEDYSAVFVPSVIYMLGAALSIVSVPYTPLLLVKGQQRVLFGAYAVGSLAYILSLTLGVIYWGLIGASTAFPILYVIYIFVVWRYSYREGVS